MNCQLGEIVWEDFPNLLREARRESREGAGSRPAREKLFAPVEKALRQWTYRNYGYDPWCFDIRRSDVIQQAYLCAWRSFDEFHGSTETEFLAWIMRILENELKQILRKGKQERRFVSRIDSTSYVEFAQETPNLLEEYVHREQRRIFLEAFAQLPEDYQRVLIFRHQDELPYEEIGPRMNRSPDAARMLCHRAREKLLHLVGKEGESPTAEP
jgi:RNA polymerase sigma factor (sigma-70 family)